MKKRFVDLVQASWFNLSVSLDVYNYVLRSLSSFLWVLFENFNSSYKKHALDVRTYLVHSRARFRKILKYFNAWTWVNIYSLYFPNREYQLCQFFYIIGNCTYQTIVSYVAVIHGQNGTSRPVSLSLQVFMSRWPILLLIFFRVMIVNGHVSMIFKICSPAPLYRSTWVLRIRR